MTKILIDRAVVEEVIATIEDSGEMMLAAIVERQDRAVEALRAALAEPVQEPAFHGFMSADGTRVDLCFTPGAPRADGTYATAYYTAPPPAEPVQEPDLSRCPKCNGPADNGHDREVPPNPYVCTKCMAEPVQEPWEHLKQYGYAPGSYMSRCHACDKIASGVDKRAITCRPCAEARRAALAEPVQEPAPMPPFPPVSLWKRGCAVCGIGAGGHAYGYACPRSDCPTRVTCGGTV